jgi:H+/Cl- antiporter ClcA
MPAPSPDPMAMLRSRTYVRLLVLAAVLGVPISAVAYGFLALVASLQDWLFSDLPKALGFDGAPRWWPLPMLTLAGVLGALIIRYLPGNGAIPQPMGSRPAACRRRSSSPASPSRHWQPSVWARCSDPMRR